MTEQLYSKEMAGWYDEMYCNSDKTSKEIEFISSICRNYNIKSIIDVACGSGRHSIRLKQAGFNVTGVDLSSALIALAKKNATKVGVKIPFFVQDMRNIRLEKKFDMAMIYYTSLGYLDSNDDVIQALTSIHHLLKPHGVVLIETHFAWPKIVKGQKMGFTSEKIVKGNKTYEVIDEPYLDPINNYIYSTHTHIRKIGKKELPILKDSTPTKIRLFFPNEIDLFFRLTGFKLLKFYGDVDGHGLSKDHSRRLIALAQKV